jgi:hypothetical protein
VTEFSILSKLIPSCIRRKVLDISSPAVFRMKNRQDAGIDKLGHTCT